MPEWVKGLFPHYDAAALAAKVDAMALTASAPRAVDADFEQATKDKTKPPKK